MKGIAKPTTGDPTVQPTDQPTTGDPTGDPTGRPGSADRRRILKNLISCM